MQLLFPPNETNMSVTSDRIEIYFRLIYGDHFLQISHPCETATPGGCILHDRQSSAINKWYNYQHLRHTVAVKVV